MFPLFKEGLLEATQFTSIWATKGPARVIETKIFWFLMESSLCMAIDQHSRLSPNLYEQLLAYAAFKADFDHVYI